MKANKLEDYLSNTHEVFINHNFSPSSPQNRIYSPYCRFVSTYHNITNEYVNPLNNISLCSIPEIEHIENQQYYMSRDGLIPLLDFFLQFPSPLRTTPQIAVNEQYIDYIPKDWNEYIIPYKFAYCPIWKNPFNEIENRDNLLITLYPCDHIISLENIKKILEDISPQQYKKVYIYVQYGHSFFKHHDEVLRHTYKVINDMNRHFKCETEIITDTHLFGKVDLKTCNFLELNHNGILWYDNFLIQRILSKGARPHFTTECQIDDKSFLHRQSLNHGVVLTEKKSCGSKHGKVKEILQDLNMKDSSRLLDQKELCSFLFGYLENQISPKKIYLEII
ncbi:hypothetical protein [Bacteriovorax sp. Seq25_V]|uniref:hypothetical protein n=1 Tax=Bacteriovorax sp. Seq25_V TaxID=1201288 RepID=UPI000389F0A7|nr:hypothetical protein [Bacteriovorax sp. Seq25_V]EQC47901.1 hypothetical protein M900_A0019 [Bacteriovorax sp. Seq25_V]